MSSLKIIVSFAQLPGWQIHSKWLLGSSLKKLRRVCLSAVHIYLLCRQKPGEGQYLLACLVCPDEICHYLKTQPCLFCSHMKTSLISHICSCLSNTRERKQMNLKPVQTLTHVTSDTCVPGEMGTAVTLSFPSPCPILRVAMLVLCHKAVTGFGLRDLMVWTRPPEGREGMWDGSQAKSDDGNTLRCRIVLKEIS